MKANLKASENCIRLIKEFEGLHRIQSDGLVYAYKCPTGVLTVGYGSTRDPFLDTPVTEKTVLTKDDCHRWLVAEVEEVAVDVANQVKGLQINNNMFDALVSFVYNIGPNAFGQSTLLRRLKAYDYFGAATEFDRWVYGYFGNEKRVIAGLKTRRKLERELFETKLELPET